MKINELNIQEASAFKTLYSVMFDNFFISYLIIIVFFFYFSTKDLDKRVWDVRNWSFFDWLGMSLGTFLLVVLGYMLSAFFE